MKLKKLLAAVTATALAVTTMAVTSFTASAATLTTVPEGTREVLATAVVTYAPTSAWDNGPWGQITDVNEDWMTDNNIYIEAKFSNVGGATTENGEQSFDEAKGWATILHWYNNNKIDDTDELDVSQNFDVEFTACANSTADNCVAYAPISNFKRVSWGGIAGNLQSGHVNGFTLNSLSIVKFTTGGTGTGGGTTTTPGDDDNTGGTNTTPDDNTGSDTPSTGGSALWEGTLAASGSWGEADRLQLAADKFANITAGGKIRLTVTPSENAQFKLMDGNWTPIASIKSDPTYNAEYDVVQITSSTYEFEIAAADVELLKASGLIVAGQNFTLTKVEYIAASSSGSDTPSGPSTPTTPTEPTTPTIPDPFIYTPSSPSQTTIADNIIAAADGGNVSINLGSSTKLDKATMDVLAARGDVTVKFNVSGTAYWLINGNNVTNAKGVDLGVTVNSKAISEKKVADFAGDKDTIQLSLKHNGDFGFTGTLNIPVNKSYNGKFANLYYYHGGKFEFVGSSAIANGRTQFAFSHASNYLIVIDDYAYGEDVSTGAGMIETTPEASAVPYVAVLVLISAFGASAIVLKKRLSK